MIKIVILICHLTGPACTEDSAVAAIMADRQDDGTPCPAIGGALLNQMRTNLEGTGTRALVRCQKDGKPFY